MNKLDLVKKYIKFNDFSKAINIAFKNIKLIPLVEQKEMIDYLIDDLLIPMANDSVIEELGDIIKGIPELSDYYDNKISSYNPKMMISIDVDSDLISKIRDVFVSLNFLDVADEKIKYVESIEIDFNTSKELIYGKYSKLKLEIIKNINAEFFNISNRTEIEIIIENITNELDARLKNDENNSSIFSFFYDEMIFDLELIVKSFIISPNILSEKMLEIYNYNALPCGWDGIYPEGKLVYVSNP